MSNTSVIVPSGFSFAAVSSGIKKSGALDLAIIFSENIATTAGVFTRNKIRAAPVKLGIKRISSQKGQAIIINSGNANACTGIKGYSDAKEMTKLAAARLGIPPQLVYVSSTGVIGRPLPMEKIKKAVPLLIDNLSPSGINKVATAIMTTDTFEKIFSIKIRIGAKTGTITGIAKGAGMICPDMATMLCFICTDIAVTPTALNAALHAAVKGSFNRISIDNDMSTNDTAMIMANGLLQNAPVSKGTSSYRKFVNALSELTHELAKMIVRDGEGATKLVEITVLRARTETEAEKIARSIANSMLVKTAIYGRDPNWGRIIAAIGYSGAEVNEKKIDIYLNNVRLVRKGLGTKKEEVVRDLLASKDIAVSIDLGTGTKSAKVLTCDLTEEYIKINAHYTT